MIAPSAPQRKDCDQFLYSSKLNGEFLLLVIWFMIFPQRFMTTGLQGILYNLQLTWQQTSQWVWRLIRGIHRHNLVARSRRGMVSMTLSGLGKEKMLIKVSSQNISCKIIQFYNSDCFFLEANQLIARHFCGKCLQKKHQPVRHSFRINDYLNVLDQIIEVCLKLILMIFSLDIVSCSNNT